MGDVLSDEYLCLWVFLREKCPEVICNGGTNTFSVILLANRLFFSYSYTYMALFSELCADMTDLTCGDWLLKSGPDWSGDGFSWYHWQLLRVRKSDACNHEHGITLSIL